MAMEYIQGQDLSRITMKTARTQTYFHRPRSFYYSSSSRSLQFAHQRQDEMVFAQYCAFDISPQNIRIQRRRGEVDGFWHFSRFLKEENTEYLRGKYAYSPNSRGRVLDARTDLCLMIVL